MLHLLHPIWLLAASGIIIPIAIHLWNIKQGKTLKVGSIVLLTRRSQEYASSLRVTDLFLLLLRCLLIILLALLLGKPYWQNNGSGKGWILMERKDEEQAYRHYKSLVDSLVQAGYEFHLFEKGFEKKDLASVAQEHNDTTNAESSSYWKLIKQLNDQLPQNFPVYLFTSNRLNRFTGNRPEVSVAFKWQTFTNKDSTATFISKAYTSSVDSIAVIMGETNPSATFYKREVIAVNQPKQKYFTLNVVNGNLAVAYKNQPVVLVDTSTLRITVFAGTYFNDARYILAALQSIQQVSRRKMKLSVVTKTGDINGKQDWLFWLADQPVPSNIHAANILSYETGNAISMRSWLKDTNGEGQISLYRRISYHQKNAENIWIDGFGDPVLIKESGDAKNVYRFYSHFDPAWNDLVWSESFPQLMYTLIDNAVTKETTHTADQRTINERQIQLNITPYNKKTNTQSIDSTNAKRILWMIIFILFFIERYFSFKQKRERLNA